MNSAQSALARRMRQGCTAPPLTPLLHRVAAKFLIACFAKFSSNFAKFKIILSKFRVLQKIL